MISEGRRMIVGLISAVAGGDMAVGVDPALPAIVEASAGRGI